jgi:hypothetical protein
VFLYRISFWLFIIFNYLIGGALVVSGVFYYRPIMSVVFLTPLLLLTKNIDRHILIAHILIVIYLIINGYLNDTNYIFILYAISIPVISFFIYTTVYNYVNKFVNDDLSIRRHLNIFYVIAILQLPVIILQSMYSDIVINNIFEQIGFDDVRFGTFYFKGDQVMSFFLSSVIITLISKKRSAFQNIVLITSIMSIYLAGSKITQVVLIPILLYVIFNKYKLKSIVIVPIVISITLISMISTEAGRYAIYDLYGLYENITQGDSDYAVDNFYQGGYGRIEALNYLQNKGILILGFGSSTYFDMVEKRYILGLHGFYILNYAEIGIIGLLLYIKLILAIYKKKNYIEYNMYYFSIIIFISLGTTINLFNNVALMMIVYYYVELNKKIRIISSV